ncbi:DMT family transporter, partial [bacterium]|nr:DMT family transporter [bacterium]
DPLWVNIFRFLSAAIMGALIVLAVPSLRRSFRWADWRRALSPGLWLGLTLVLQTVGLLYTSVAKSGFITCLYVVIVPVVGQLVLKQRVPRRHYLWVGLALVGAAMICEMHSIGINLGDWLTLACAFAASAQILEIDRLAPKTQSAFAFTIGQAFWAAVPALALLPFWGTWPQFPLPWLAWAGVAELSIMASLLAFGIQVRAQRVVPPAMASLVFLLESPFAALFGFLLLGEVLSPMQGVGAALIMLATGCSLSRGKRG